MPEPCPGYAGSAQVSISNPAGEYPAGRLD
jgi:hypothetical protein